MKTKNPNIVFLLTDDQRFDTIHALNNPDISTPNMDRLLARGTAFSHACIQGGTSPAVCMPSRAMIHTGRTLFNIHEGGASLPPAHTTLAEALRQAGYTTFGTGKWHNGKEAFHRGFTAGSEIFFGGMADHWNVPAFDFDPEGRYDKSCLFIPDPGKSNEVLRRNCDHIHAGRHSTDGIAEAATDFINTYSGKSPFFAYVSFLAPHDPRSMPEAFRALYDPENLPLPENFMGGHPFDNGELHVRDEMLAGFPRTPRETRRHLAEYYAMISHLDARIGDIIAAVERKGCLDDTVFVMAGDNGLALGRHGLMGKQNLYEHSIRVPLVFAGPGIPEGAVVESPALLSDIFPTLCDLCAIPVPASVEGKSLRGAILEGDRPHDALYLAYRDKQRALRTQRFKLIEYVVGERHTTTQLFDLEKDPFELNNLADDPDRGDVLNDLRRELRTRSESSHDRQSPWGETFWRGYSL